MNESDSWVGSASIADIGPDGSRPDTVADPGTPPLEWVIQNQLAHLRRVSRMRAEDLVRRAQARSAQVHSALVPRALPSAFDSIRWRAGVERSAGDEPATLPGTTGPSTEMVVLPSPATTVPATAALERTVAGQVTAVSSGLVRQRRRACVAVAVAAVIALPLSGIGLLTKGGDTTPAVRAVDAKQPTTTAASPTTVVNAPALSAVATEAAQPVPPSAASIPNRVPTPTTAGRGATGRSPSPAAPAPTPGAPSPSPTPSPPAPSTNPNPFCQVTPELCP